MNEMNIFYSSKNKKEIIIVYGHEGLLFVQ